MKMIKDLQFEYRKAVFGDNIKMKFDKEMNNSQRQSKQLKLRTTRHKWRRMIPCAQSAQVLGDSLASPWSMVSAVTTGHGLIASQSAAERRCPRLQEDSCRGSEERGACP